MLRLLFWGSLLLSASALGCVQEPESGGGGGNSGGGGTPIFEPGPSCTGFCALAVGECEVVVLGTEDECEQNCELERSFAEQTSAACLTAFEAAVDCAAELECQAIIDQANQVNVDAYPCRPEVEVSTQVCG
ncbi:MAG: hypothetical protein HKP50_04305 [Myxococcales bacterium]|nr:hypothetical protein [Myxococcales bacterium]